MDTNQYPAGTRFRSVVTWPDSVSTGNDKHESDDMHDTYGGAEAVCNGIKRRGLGGEGKVFPLRTRIDPVLPASDLPEEDPPVRESGFGRPPPDIMAILAMGFAMYGPRAHRHRGGYSDLFDYRRRSEPGFVPTPVTPDQLADIRAENKRRRAANFAKLHGKKP